jgi:putative hydrolase of the HAD superfamily
VTDQHGGGREIEAVIYDYGGVFSGSPFHAIRTYEQSLGLEEGAISALMFGRSYAHGEGDEADEHDWHKLETGRIEMQEWWDGVQRRAPEVLGPDVEFDMVTAFSGGGGTAISWEMVHHVRRVRAGGKRIAICTNNVKEYGGWWRQSIPIELIDVVIDSSEEGVRKPDPEIYLFADDLDANVEGARAVGMVGVLVPHNVREAIDEIEALLGI